MCIHVLCWCSSGIDFHLLQQLVSKSFDFAFNYSVWLPLFDSYFFKLSSYLISSAASTAAAKRASIPSSSSLIWPSPAPTEAAVPPTPKEKAERSTSPNRISLRRFQPGHEWETELQVAQAFNRPPRHFKDDPPFYPWLPRPTPLVNFHLNYKF